MFLGVRSSIQEFFQCKQNDWRNSGGTLRQKETKRRKRREEREEREENEEREEIEEIITSMVMMMMTMLIVMIKTHHHPSLSSPPSLQEVFRPCPSCFAAASSSSSLAGFETRPDDHDDHNADFDDNEGPRPRSWGP